MSPTPSGTPDRPWGQGIEDPAEVGRNIAAAALDAGRAAIVSGTPDRCNMCQRARSHASHLPGVFYHHTFEDPTPSGTPEQDEVMAGFRNRHPEAPELFGGTPDRGGEYCDVCGETRLRSGVQPHAKWCGKKPLAPDPTPTTTPDRERLRAIVGPVIGDHIGGPYTEVPFLALSRFNEALVDALLDAGVHPAGPALDVEALAEALFAVHAYRTLDEAAAMARDLAREYQRRVTGQ